MFPLLSFYLVLQYSLVLARRPCYWPNGKESGAFACNETAPESHCCGELGHCLSNGLCIWDKTNGTWGDTYVKGQCTDPFWADPRCPRHCMVNQDRDTNSSAFDFKTGGVLILQCDGQGYEKDSNYCCVSQSEGKRCCQTSSALSFIEKATLGAYTGLLTSGSSTSFVATTSSSSSFSALTSTSTILATPGSQPSASQSNGWKIGAGVGGGVGGLALISAVLFLVLRLRKMNKKIGELDADKRGTGGDMEEDAKVAWFHSVKPEMSTESEVRELPINQPVRVFELSVPHTPVEMDGRSNYGGTSTHGEETWRRANI